MGCHRALLVQLADPRPSANRQQAGRTNAAADRVSPRLAIVPVLPGIPGYSGCLDGLEAFALDPLALELAGAPNGLSRLAGASLGRLFVVATQLHLAENAFALHLLLERLQRLIDIVVTDENLHLAAFSLAKPCCPCRPIRNARIAKRPAFTPGKRRLYHSFALAPKRN